MIGKALLWLLWAGLVVLLIVTAPRGRLWTCRRQICTRQCEARIVHTLEATSEASLPTDISARACELWQAGGKRQALALLYRGSLRSLAAQIGREVPTAATENECLHLAQQLPTPGQRNLFARLVHAWQCAAYAQRWPEEDEFMALSGKLAQHFQWQG